jgi:flavin-binding protein dodecin
MSEKEKKELEPNTPEHEEAVKKVIKAATDSIEALEKLDVVESKQIQIGNNFLLFRFRN